MHKGWAPRPLAGARAVLFAPLGNHPSWKGEVTNPGEPPPGNFQGGWQNAALPVALDEMTRQSEGEPSPVAPVDLSQAILGPGMAIFSQYSAGLEAHGSAMTVRIALGIIN